MNSILSFPERGPYGKSSWRGNTSGHVIKELLNYYMPKLFVDPAEGSGTSRDVAKELECNYIGLDLHSGFNLLKDRLLERLPRQADYIFFHPPYHDIIKYSGKVWGTPHPDDLSRCSSPEEFMEKLQISLVNIYDAVCRNGHYTVMIGDVRKAGHYWSIQSDIIQIAPGRLEGVLVKAQHNCVSDSRQYGGRFIPIMHEYILNFKKEELVIGMIDCAMAATSRLTSLNRATWRAVVENALLKLGGKAKLH